MIIEHTTYINDYSVIILIFSGCSSNVYLVVASKVYIWVGRSSDASDKRESMHFAVDYIRQVIYSYMFKLDIRFIYGSFLFTRIITLQIPEFNVSPKEWRRLHSRENSICGRLLAALRSVA